MGMAVQMSSAFRHTGDGIIDYPIYSQSLIPLQMTVIISLSCTVWFGFRNLDEHARATTSS